MIMHTRPFDYSRHRHHFLTELALVRVMLFQNKSCPCIQPPLYFERSEGKQLRACFVTSIRSSIERKVMARSSTSKAVIFTCCGFQVRRQRRSTTIKQYPLTTLKEPNKEQEVSPYRTLVLSIVRSPLPSEFVKDASHKIMDFLFRNPGSSRADPPSTLR